MNKRAVSEIVSTVLIISITVVAVGIIMAWVVPMIRTSLNSGQSCLAAQNDVSIAVDGNNCVNNSGNGTVFVTVKKGADESVVLKAVQVIISVNGSSYSNIQNTSSSLPGLNEERTYNFSGTGTSSYVGAQKVSIAPIVSVGKTSKTCSESQQVVLATCA